MTKLIMLILQKINFFITNNFIFDTNKFWFEQDWLYFFKNVYDTLVFKSKYKVFFRKFFFLSYYLLLNFIIITLILLFNVSFWRI